MKRQTVTDQIEIKANGIVQIRLYKQIVDDDGSVISQEYHRTSLLPGDNLDELMGIVNTHLQAMKWAPITDYSQIAAHVKVAHTPDVVAKFKAEQERMNASPARQNQPA